MLQLFKKQAKLIFIFTLVILTFFTGTAKAYEALVDGVFIAEDGEKTYYKTSQNTVEDFLKEEQIVLTDEDKVSPALDAIIEDKMTITIQRAIDVTIVVDKGVTKTIKTSEITAARVLANLIKEDGVTYALDESVNPSKHLKSGDTIKVTTKTEETEVVTQAVPFETQTSYDDQMAEGKEQVTVQGVDGTREVTVKKTYLAGELSFTEEIKNVVTKQPIAQVVVQGTRKENVIETENGTFKSVDKITMSATAYTALTACATKKPGSPGYGITATGMVAQKGVVAVDPRVIPLGTKLFIEGYGYAVAADTGGSIKSNRIDLCFNTQSECISFGRRTVTVHVLDEM